EVVPGVDVDDGEREATRPERLLGEAQQHARVLAARKQEGGSLEGGGDLAHDVHALVLEVAEVAGQLPAGPGERRHGSCLLTGAARTRTCRYRPSGRLACRLPRPRPACRASSRPRGSPSPPVG